MTIQPLSNNVLLEPLEKEQEVNGIILPDTAKETPQVGKVIEIGQGKLIPIYQSSNMVMSGVPAGMNLIPSKLKKGMSVVYKKWQAHEVKLEGKKFVLVNEDDILGIVI